MKKVEVESCPSRKRGYAKRACLYIIVSLSSYIAIYSFLTTVHPYILHGDSMYPNISYIALGVCDSSDYREGDVVLFRYHGMQIAHRVVKIEGDIVIAKGDNNSYTEIVRKEDVVCRLKIYDPIKVIRDSLQGSFSLGGR